MKGPSGLKSLEQRKRSFHTQIYIKREESLSIWAAWEHELSGGVLFLYKRKQDESLGYLSPKTKLFSLKVSPHSFTLPTIFSKKKQNKKNNFSKRLRERSLKLVRRVCQGSL